MIHKIFAHTLCYQGIVFGLIHAQKGEDIRKIEEEFRVCRHRRPCRCRLPSSLSMVLFFFELIVIYIIFYLCFGLNLLVPLSIHDGCPMIVIDHNQ